MSGGDYVTTGIVVIVRLEPFVDGSLVGDKHGNRFRRAAIAPAAPAWPLRAKIAREHERPPENGHAVRIVDHLLTMVSPSASGDAAGDTDQERADVGVES